MYLNGRLDAAVESDIVGYTTIEMKAGTWYQVGSPFVGLDASKEQTINDVLTTGFSNDDELYIYNEDSQLYTVYLIWYDLGSVKGWLTLDGELSQEKITPGTAFFINKKTAGSVTLSGKVSAVDAVTFGSDAGGTWSQIVCVWPDKKGINDMYWENVGDDDELYIYNPETKTYDTYLIWYDLGTVKGWLTLDGALSDKVITPGQALFINKKSKGVGKLLPEAPAN